MRTLGEQCVMMAGVLIMQEWHAISLDTDLVGDQV